MAPFTPVDRVSVSIKIPLNPFSPSSFSPTAMSSVTPHPVDVAPSAEGGASKGSTQRWFWEPVPVPAPEPNIFRETVPAPVPKHRWFWETAPDHDSEPHPTTTTICSCCATQLGAGASAPAPVTTWAKRSRGLFSLLALAICSPVLLPVLLITMASVAAFYTLKHYAQSAYRKLLKPSTEVTVGGGRDIEDTVVLSGLLPYLSMYARSSSRARI